MLVGGSTKTNGTHFIESSAHPLISGASCWKILFQLHEPFVNPFGK